MGLRGASDRGQLEGELGPAPGRALMVAVLLVTSALLAPLAGAIGDATTSTDDDFQCRGGWWGFDAGNGGHAPRACFHVEADPPSFASDHLRSLEFPPDVRRADCPEGFGGIVVERKGTQLGVCSRVEYVAPTDPWVDVYVDLSACELEDGRQGEDPAIFIADGGIAICILPIVEPGQQPPEIELSTEPCEPRTVDPEVRVGDGHLTICFDVDVFGAGSPQVNMLLTMAEDTVDGLMRLAATP